MLTPARLRTWLDRLVAPKSATEDARRQEHILNILLVGSLTFFLTAMVRVFILAPNSARGFVPYLERNQPIPLFCFIVFLVLYILSRRGKFRLSSYVFLFIYFLVGCYLVAIWGVALPAAVFMFSLVIIMASILVSTRAALVATVAVSLFYLGFPYFVANGSVTPLIDWRLIPESRMRVQFYVINFSLITLVSWLSNREIERSLRRARRSEAALTKERDQLEIKVEERTKDLEQLQMEKLSQLYRFAELGKVTSGILHDLVNPLSALTANLDKLESADQERLLKRVKTGTHRIEEYIAEARKQIRNQKTSSLFLVNKEITFVVSTLADRAKETGVPIQVEKLSDAYLFGSFFRFRQLILNLLNNAFDSYADKQAKGPITIRSYREKGTVCVEIADQGSGISPANQDQIFVPLFSTKDHGTGLGLTLSKEIVEADFNGTITVTSQKGEGTTISLCFPEHDRTPHRKPGTAERP